MFLRALGSHNSRVCDVSSVSSFFCVNRVSMYCTALSNDVNDSEILLRVRIYAMATVKNVMCSEERGVFVFLFFIEKSCAHV